MTIPFKVNDVKVLVFDIENQDIIIPRGNVSETPTTAGATLCTTGNCYNCNQVHCTQVRCTQVRCTQVKCTQVKCTQVKCTTHNCKCDCTSDG